MFDIIIFIIIVLLVAKKKKNPQKKTVVTFNTERNPIPTREIQDFKPKYSESKPGDYPYLDKLKEKAALAHETIQREIASSHDTPSLKSFHESAMKSAQPYNPQRNTVSKTVLDIPVPSQPTVYNGSKVTNMKATIMDDVYKNLYGAKSVKLNGEVIGNSHNSVKKTYLNGKPLYK